MAFDVEGARKAGYSDAEIASHLAQSRAFDVEGARKAGYTDPELIAHLSSAPDAKSADAPSKIPGNQPEGKGEKEPKTLGEKVVAAAKMTGETVLGIVGPGGPGGMGGPAVKDAVETALSVGSGLTTGSVGMVTGAAGGAADVVASGKFGTPEGQRQIAQAAGEGAENLTYSPRRPNAQEAVETVGKGMQALIPVMPHAGPIAAAARAASPAASTTAGASSAAVKDALRVRVQEALAKRQAAQQAPSTPTPGTMGSVVAAGTDIATVRRMSAQELPAPIELTKGQATRTFEQQRFEREMAKDPVKGQPLRERFAQQNDALLKNFDLWVDETGATKADLPSVGDAVTAALRERAMADKARIRSAYKAAEKSGDMEAPVTLADAVNYLNENAPDAVVAPILDAVKARAVRTGVAALGADGELVPQPVPLKTAELFRRAISNATDAEPTNIRHSAQIKGLIDQATDGAGGTLYKEARKLRSRYAQNYENIGLVRDLMNTKRGLSDQRVAAEDVFRRAVLSSSMADVKQVRRLLQTGGESGQQAWKELQGAAVRHIRDQATKNVARNERGQEIISPAGLDKAVQQLDQSGKLDFIFGRRGAEQLRAVNDLAKVVYTAPPGAVNTSNTASVILAALDMATSGLVGMPVPIMSGLRILTTHVKDRQIQRRIQEALGIKPEPKKVKGPVSVVPKTPAQRVPESRTVH